MDKVIPGIYRLKLPLTMPMTDSALAYINAYLVKGDSGYLLVDTGWGTTEAFNSLKKQLAEVGAEFKDISQIVVTHIHPDHYGLVGKLKGLSQAKFFLHDIEKALIESRYTNMDSLLRQTAHWLHSNGVPPEELPNLQTASLAVAKFVLPAPPDVTLYGGETISTGVFTFQTLWTPGHSPGHICLYEPTQKILLSGDHILPTITSNAGLHPQSGGNPLGDYLNSLNAVKQLDVALVLPGHENPFTGLKPRIEELIQHHKQRDSKIMAALNAEPKTAYQISRETTWLSDAGGVSWQNLPPLDKRLAVLETLSHLELMRIDGKIDKFSRNGIIYYQQLYADSVNAIIR